MRPIKEWRKESRCIGFGPKGRRDTDHFFTGVGENPTKARKELCANCPVIAECLDYAIIYDEEGVWGGTTKRERERLNYIKDSLVSQAKSLGILENRPSIDRMIQEDRQKQLRLERDSVLPRVTPLEELEPLAEQLVEEYDPTVRAAS